MRSPGASTDDGAPALSFELRCPADPVVVHLVRHAVADWLLRLGWPEPEQDDLVYAVSEACTNAVEHAYRPGPAGEVQVVARVLRAGGRQRAIVRVRDWGTWKPPAQDPGFRGRGLEMAEASVHRMRLTHDDDGTVVSLMSRSVWNGATAVGHERRPPGGAVDGCTLAARRAGELRERAGDSVAQADEVRARSRDVVRSSSAVLARSTALQVALRARKTG